MMKHILSLFLCVSLILLAGTAFCFAEESISVSTLTEGMNSTPGSGTCGDNLTWELDENGVLTISGTGAMQAYSDSLTLSDVNTVIIEAGVTSIGNGAFAGCSNLTNITIPSSVTSIGNGAFFNCTSLTDITLPNSLTDIGADTFHSCTGLTNITLPNSLTDIGAHAFHSCTGLTNITLPNSLQTIGTNAFYCSGLTGSIRIPASVTSIEFCPFAACGKLEQINVDANNTAYSSIDGILYNKLQTEIRCCPNGFKNSVILPNTVTTIVDCAFSLCRALTSITIPNGVTTIGNAAFDACTGLTSITIPSSVTSIGNVAFADCSALTSVTIPSSVTSIGNSVFVRCPDVVLKVDAGSYAEQYAKSNELNYGIIGHTFSKFNSVIPSNSYFYRGASIVPEYSQKIKIYCYETDELLVQGRDYEVEYSDPVNAGMCHVTVRGINGYDGIDGKPSSSLPDGDGSLKGSFVILARSLTDRATVTLDSEECWYTGEAICPEVSVECFMDDVHVVYSGETDWPYVGYQTLIQDKDYTVSYSNNTEPGTAEIIITGTGNFSSTVTETFEILPSIKIPSFVTEIGSQAFANTAAEVIIIPETCSSVAADAFDGCTELKYIVNYSALTIIPPEGVTVKNEQKAAES